MTLEELFKQRTTIHQKQLFRYAKYVFNDHFIIALLILLGAGGLAYSEYVDTLNAEMIFPQILLIVIVTGLISVGKIATLLQSADIAFLLPKEEDFPSVFWKFAIRSFFLLSIPIAMLSALSMPLLVGTGNLTFTQWPILLLIMLGSKWMDLLIILLNFSKRNQTESAKMIWSIRGYTAFVLGLSIFLSVWVGLAVVVITSTVATLYIKKHIQKKAKWQWEKMIEIEKIRVQRIYRFIHLFTDIPFMETKTRRLKVFDPLIEWASSRRKDPNYYFLVRVFFRNTTYSGLVFRLSIIGGLLLIFSEVFILSLVIQILFMYLIGFQLLPLGQNIENHLQFRLYPLEAIGKIDAIKHLIFELLLGVNLLFSVIVFFSNYVEGSISLVVGVVFSWIFCSVYLPKRLQNRS